MQQSHSEKHSVTSLFNCKFSINNRIVTPSAYCVIIDGEEKRVTPKVMQVLLHLVAAGEFAVSRDELLESIWQNNFEIGRGSLKTAIYKLRKLLDAPNSATSSSCIKTVARSGYQLTGTVQILQEKKMLKTPMLSPVMEPIPNNSVAFSWFSGKLASSVVIVLLLITSLLFFYFQPWFGTNKVTKQYAELLFSRSGVERYPLPSPDDKQLAFVGQDNSGINNIYIRKLKAKGQETYQLTHTVHNEHSPVWGPEGLQLAFIRQHQDGSCAIYVIDLISKSEKELTDCHGDATLNRFLSWSPDGKWLAFASFHPATSTSGLVRVNLKDRRQEQLTSSAQGLRDYNPVWSPNSQSLAFVRYLGLHQHDIFILSLDKERTVRRVTSDAKYNFGISWTPDGKNLLYSSNRSGRVELWQVDVTNLKVSLFSPDEDLFYPAYSHDGQTVYATRYQRQSHIYGLALNGNNNIKPVIRNLGLNTSPHYSPQQDRLIFQSNTTGFMEVWSSRPDGSDLTQLTNFKNRWFINSRPKWSPDGQYYAFIAAADGIDQIFIGQLGKHSFIQLAQSAINKASISWSRDGLSIYASIKHQGQWRIWNYLIDGSESAQLTQHVTCSAQEGPQAKIIYLTFCDKPGILQLDLITGQQELITEDVSFADKENWVVTDNGIYYVKRTPEHDQVNFYDFASKAITLARSMPVNTIMPFERLSYVAKDKTLLFSYPINLQSEVFKISNLSN